MSSPIFVAIEKIDSLLFFLNDYVQNNNNNNNNNNNENKNNENENENENENGNDLNTPKIILGVMEYGRSVDQSQAKEMTKDFITKYEKQQRQCKEIDTAYMYANGVSETFLGQMQKNLLIPNGGLISTKANPWNEYKLTYEGTIKQLNKSLERLKSDNVDIFYLHAPDHNTNIEETLKAVNYLYKNKKFKRFGLSNYSSWQVAEIYYICKLNGYPLPAVYQGMYNALTRDIEKELMPCLRKLGISFYAYNPLAGGLLTGKYKYEQIENNEIEKGRFEGNQWANVYRNRFWKKSFFNGIKLIEDSIHKIYGGGEGEGGKGEEEEKSKSKSKSITLTEASLKWLKYHSILKKNDGIILGASSLKHYNQNINALTTSDQPLHQDVVKAFDQAWEMFKPECPTYFR